MAELDEPVRGSVPSDELQRFEVASSASSDTSDPDWGVSWGGTISSVHRNLHIDVVTKSWNLKCNDWPSLEPHSLQGSSSLSRVAPDPFHEPKIISHPLRLADFSDSGDSPNLKRSALPSNLAVSVSEPSDLEVQPKLASPNRASNLFSEPTAVFPASPAPRKLHGDMLEEGAPQRSFEGAQGTSNLELRVMTGPAQGRVYHFESKVAEGGEWPKVGIGRNPGNDVVIPDDEVSSYHAEVRWDPPTQQWSLRDRGSLNGTCLNGRRISESNRSRGRKYSLAGGDLLQLGTRSQLQIAARDVAPGVEAPRRSRAVSDSFAESNSGNACSNRRSSDSNGASPSAMDVCASPPRPIRTKSSIASAEALPPITSPVAVPEWHAACWPDLGLAAAVTSIVGRQHRLKGQASEDKAGWEVPLSKAGPMTWPPVAFFGIYDGHGGVRAADEVQHRLPTEIAGRLSAGQNDRDELLPEAVTNALSGAYLALDAELACDEGCTATCLLMWRAPSRELCMMAANVGDSTALFVPLGDRAGPWTTLTTDHRLANPEEQARLSAIGVQVSRNGRLYGLNLGRSLGDKCLKDADLGLLATPSVSELVRLPADQGGLVILASDGLWDSVSSESVVDLARRAAAGESLPTATAGGSSAAAERQSLPARVADGLLGMADRYKRTDDITIMVISISPP
mmetsp:Transcript_10917/g.25927  ORF Transcript_10917/g.25927 Transcript_10917/m.25927 type:complete len:681 (+) Transcript_10917:432-2474(+)